MKLFAAVLACSLFLVACERKSPMPADPDTAHREALQGFQTTFYRVSDGRQRWIEIAIAVDGSKTFRMPVFFSDNGRLVQVGDDEARAIIQKWLKQRASNVAAFGSIDPQAGGNSPFLAIDRNSP